METQQVAFWAQPNAAPTPAPVPAPRQADTLVFEASAFGPTGRADFRGDYFRPALLRAAWEQDCGNRVDHYDVGLAQRLAAAWLLGEPPSWPDWWEPEERERVENAYQALVAPSCSCAPTGFP